MFGRFIICIATIAHVAFAAPTSLLEKRATPISSSELSSFAPFTQFARATYCGGPSKLMSWTCGAACKALPDFQPTLAGGDGNAVQFFFVGYWPTQNTIVVGHEGTDPTQLLSVLTDANILLDPLDTGLFPGVPSSVLVHSGFMNAHASTAKSILAEVKKLLAAHSTASVTCVGHSLGGALAELDSLYFKLNLPSSTKIRAFTFGTPRVGNPEFAELIDNKVVNFKRINNQEDIIPIVPGRFLGFAHPEGEVHILSAGNAVSCSGNDNASDSQCQISTVPNIFAGNILDHLGPYEGINIGTIFCN